MENGDVSSQSTWTGTDGPVKETQYHFHEEAADQEIFCRIQSLITLFTEIRYMTFLKAV